MNGMSQGEERDHLTLGGDGRSKASEMDRKVVMRNKRGGIQRFDLISPGEFFGFFRIKGDSNLKTSST